MKITRLSLTSCVFILFTTAAVAAALHSRTGDESAFDFLNSLKFLEQQK